MKYVATIKYAYDSTSMLFDKQKDAENWLDSQNNNLEHTSIITVYSDNWEEIDSYVYTGAAR